ncbi:conserved hypothetical protein [Carnobacterium maltaromaticum]|uniref:helix-turn-helix domain-containing protein n=1 Tax=Carnobacterium maltaromaticum TaxID=2751 RepID=UPI00191BA0D7|nr:helix-turn-helix domain-containing protein [Carnobacterium maltaromaticum]CAD5899519.1 conserved hypothetical protein [Carnobacterium maltaromaticum]
MRELLTTHSLRQLELLEYLYDNEWLTLGNICNTLNYSEKAIRTDIQNLNEHSEYLTIETSLKYGISLALPTNCSRTIIYSYILSESVEFNLLESIFFNENFSINKLADHLFVSVSSLRRTIKKMNKLLLKYNFQISSSPFKLIGNEAAIRNFMIHFIFEKYSDSNYPFSKFQLSALEHIFYFVEKKATFSLNYPDIDKLKIWTMVAITRIKNGNSLSKKTTSQSVYFDEVLRNQLFTKTFELIFKIKLDADTLNQMFSIFLNERYAENSSQLKEIIQNNSKQKDLHDKFKLLLTNLSSDLTIEIPNFDHVLLHLFNENNMLYGDTHVLFNKHKHFIFSSYSQNKFFYNYFLSNYQKVFSNKAHSENHIYHLCYCVLIHWKHLSVCLEKKIEPVTIGLFFNSDEEHMFFISDYIQDRFRGKCNLAIIDQRSISDLKKHASNYDIILTNIDNIELNKASNTFLYCCELLPNLDDLSTIGKMIKVKRSERIK